MNSNANSPSSLLLYYFSGTGNSYRVAAWMHDAAQTRGLEAHAAAIDAANPAVEIHGPGQVIGLLCPTHAFCAPWAMLRFAARLPRGKGAAAFAMLTRGGMKLGEKYVPGLEGSGAYLLALILALKGYRVRGAAGLDMPVSWTVVAPGYSPATAQAISDHSKPRALRFLERVLDGKNAFWSRFPLLLGLLLLPVTFAYLVMGRFFLAKLFYASSRCDGCGLCARSCPVCAIRMTGKTHPRPYWTLLCESCTRCMNFCPRGAVEASYPFGALAFYLANIPIAALLLDALARQVMTLAGWRTPLAEILISYPYKLLALAVAYLFFSLALRLPFANRLITLLTPTHYYRRYHEPGTRLKEITRH